MDSASRLTSEDHGLLQSRNRLAKRGGHLLDPSGWNAASEKFFIKVPRSEIHAEVTCSWCPRGFSVRTVWPFRAVRRESVPPAGAQLDGAPLWRIPQPSLSIVRFRCPSVTASCWSVAGAKLASVELEAGILVRFFLSLFLNLEAKLFAYRCG